ncbi:MAG: PAS domain S-box protein [Burkholderiaceae bacterium]|nr:PAS domain S-box protein [Burkholderiaceae bacterium]
MKQNSSRNTTNIGTFIVDELGVITSFSVVLSALFEYSPEEIIGYPISLLFHEFKDSVPITSSNDAIQSAFFNTESGQELIAYKKNDDSLPVWLTTSKLQIGAQHAFVCTVLDLSETKAADKFQAQLYALVESSTDAIMSKTLEGIVTSWNPAAEQMFGYSEEEMIGRPMARLLPDDRIDEETQILNKLRHGEKVDHFETIHRKKNGDLFPVAITISPMRDAKAIFLVLQKLHVTLATVNPLKPN